MVGFVDLGYNNDEREEVAATEALVLLIVGLRGNWKAPISYYFTNTVSAMTQKQLVLDALSTVSSIGIKIWTLTMDGHPANVGMAKLLGCQIEALNEHCLRFFKEPASDSKVYIIFDVCHMLKLVRNIFNSSKHMKSVDGIISWDHVKNLQHLQEECGLRLGNRLTNHHINFERQKMKVSLAAQLISASVADALQTMQETGHHKFGNVKATVNFIRIIDRLFDIFNSKNRYCSGYKSALNSENWPSTKEFLLSTKKYLLSLTDSNDIPIHKTKKHTAITGFIINIESLLNVAPDIFKLQPYLMTYRMSQDHLELLFNAIRRAGGWNNNPNVVQFASTFKKLFVRSGVQPGSSGNVAYLQHTDMLAVSHTDIQQEECCVSSDDSFLLEHYYISMWPNSQQVAIDETLAYVAGWVVKKLIPKLLCTTCRGLLISTDAPSRFESPYHLINLKNYGGLMIPSYGMVKTLMTAEQAIRINMDIFNVQKIVTFEQVMYHVKKALGSKDIFGMSDHALDTQSGIDNHYFDLLHLIVEIFYNMRLHYISKMYNLKQRAQNIRQQFTKLILFKGQ